MRKNWRMRISSDRRGKITTGIKTKSKAGKDIPKSLDYFNISKFPELVAVYGEKPDKLFIVFPSDNIDVFFQTEYVLWAKKGEGRAWKKRSCDGEVCTHHVPETLNKVKYDRGDTHECFNCGTNDCDLDPDHQCKCYTGFGAYVLDPGTGRVILFRPYRFQTNSVNSSDNILSELSKIFEQYGGIPKIPFMLSVKMQETQTKDGGKNIYPLWDCQAYGTVDQINQLAERLQLPTNETNAIAMADESKLIGAPQPSKTPIDSQVEDAPVGVDVNDPYPEQNEKKKVEPKKKAQTKKKQEPDDTGSEDHKPKAEGDILDRVGVLVNLPEPDKDDDVQMVGVIAKIAMELAGNEKTKARAILKKHSKNPNTGHGGYDSTAELKKAEIAFIRSVLAKIKKTYRDELTKAEVKANQGSVV
jgi:hypothetical protein